MPVKGVPAAFGVSTISLFNSNSSRQKEIIADLSNLLYARSPQNVATLESIEIFSPRKARQRFLRRFLLERSPIWFQRDEFVLQDILYDTV